MMKKHVFFLGICVGLLLLPLGLMLLNVGSESVAAQTLPFTPTPEPTDEPTQVILPTAPPISTSVPEPTSAPGATPTERVVVVVATPTALPKPTRTPLPPGFGRDICAPNHSLSQPCALATETDIPNLNFNENPIDVFSFLLKGGRQYRISASSANGLDPAIDVFLAGAVEQPIASNDDAEIGTSSALVTVTVEVDAWYLVRVTNKAPDSPEGKVYTLSARSVAAAGNPSNATPVPSDPDDLIGNAYDVHHAARLAWGVPYDLSMVCPEPGACYAGRHTFLLVPVKGAVPFTAVTYDLGAGVDTVLTLYKPDPTQLEEGDGQIPGWRAVASSDDIAAGWTLRSQISITPDWNSVALLVVAPSDRADMPLLPADGRPGRYRLILGSPELPPVKAVLQAQNDLPPTALPPTARPTSQPEQPAVSSGAAQDNREVIKENCPTGLAVVSEETGLYAAAPPADGDRISNYPVGAGVELLGECYRGWVKVQPQDSVTPGWMWAPTLRPELIESAVSETPEVTGTAETEHPSTRTTPTATTTATAAPVARELVFEPLSPAAVPTTVAAVPVARSLTVVVCREVSAKQPQCGSTLASVRVDILLAATHEVRVTGVTDDRGRVTLSTSVPNGTSLALRIPALGLQVPIEAHQTEITVRLPAGGS
jgi:hypothetical protein